MLREAVEAEAQFAEDLLGQGVAGMSTSDMREYLQYVADQRLGRLGMRAVYGSTNPFAFMELQDVQELLQLLRAPGHRLPGGGRRHRGLRRGVLAAGNPLRRAQETRPRGRVS